LIDPVKVYVIGGFVDHNRLKGATFEFATAAGLRTAKLPLGEFVVLNSRAVLTVNQGQSAPASRDASSF
jgi:tRNA (guanine9-N1)-methyltransferase